MQYLEKAPQSPQHSRAKPSHYYNYARYNGQQNVNNNSIQQQRQNPNPNPSIANHSNVLPEDVTIEEIKNQRQNGGENGGENKGGISLSMILLVSLLIISVIALGGVGIYFATKTNSKSKSSVKKAKTKKGTAAHRNSSKISSSTASSDGDDGGDEEIEIFTIWFRNILNAEYLRYNPDNTEKILSWNSLMKLQNIANLFEKEEWFNENHKIIQHGLCSYV